MRRDKRISSSLDLLFAKVSGPNKNIPMGIAYGHYPQSIGLKGENGSMKNMDLIIKIVINLEISFASVFTSRLRHGHGMGWGLVLVLLGTFSFLTTSIT